MTDRNAARARHKILVVEDEPSIRTLLVSAFHAAGWSVSTAGTGRSALFEIGCARPDLIVLDVMLPDLDGFDVTRRLRAAGDYTPVLFLTARTDIQDRIAGLSSGGDDYVTKPFHIEEVLLRIRAIMRRAGGDPSSPAAARAGTLRFADLTLDEAAHEVRRAGTYLRLSPTEFRLLACLMAHPNRVLTKADILDQVWHYDFNGDARIVDTYVKYLRRKVDRVDPPLIHTVRGVGYCLRVPRESAGESPC
ncbi:response regulator transcription factor [Streptomyces sp. DT24]|uniref:response regulator transcription factor n=1 Tax=unclassified Streptomyces TaxID=2593676 RepID=UPI0023B92430|nr:response regulator transcription factor [Streptomyces sp. AM 4-1-1]WEH36709.1 response regulator transcription factor [Streptomyces sp. AM 4-1-1]